MSLLLALQAISISTGNIQSNEILGNASITSTINVSVNGITTSEKLGAPTITNVTSINIQGISSQEIFGNISITTTYTIQAHGIQSNEKLGALGTTTITNIQAHGIQSNEKLGSPTIVSTYAIQAHGIISGQLLGNASVAYGLSDLTIFPGSINSLEEFGSLYTGPILHIDITSITQSNSIRSILEASTVAIVRSIDPITSSAEKDLITVILDSINM